MFETSRRGLIRLNRSKSSEGLHENSNFAMSRALSVFNRRVVSELVTTEENFKFGNVAVLYIDFKLGP